MTSPPGLPTVTVTANTHREVPPDSFVLTGRVSARGGDSSAALTELAGRYRQLEDAIAALPPGVDVRHESISNWPDGGRRQFWNATRAVTLTGSDLATVGDVANAIASVPDVALEGPTWLVGRNNPAHAELQAEAVHEARARAERYALALGGGLGRLVELRDQGGGHWQAQSASMDSMMLRGGAPELTAIDLSPQPIEISASVNATWYLVLPE